MVQIHTYARQGNIQGVVKEIAKGVDVDCVDRNNPQTPLMLAVQSQNANLDLICLLIENGADINAIEAEFQTPVLGLAVKSGNLAKIKYLLDSGAKIDYQRPHGYDVLIDAMHGRDIVQDSELISLLKLLLDRGAKVDGISSYGETALRVASRLGRFDAVDLLLKSGCDRQQLAWTPLMFAIALGKPQDVKNLLNKGANLEARDYWQRTPWLLSIQAGDLAKAKLILASGANRSDRGICGKTPLMYAVENRQVSVLQWLIEQGFDIEATNEFAETPLMLAAEVGATECFRILLETGADISKTDHIDEKVITQASNLSIVSMLIAAGEDLNDINEEMRKELTGVSIDELEVTEEQYLQGKHRRFGTTNPELMDLDFWQGMIRWGKTAWHAKQIFDDTSNDDEPVWCYDRFGRTITQLPDGRIVEIAGEHEDYYDPDFCIYNDVVVYDGQGSFKILGYPRDVFPPTDFHTATLVGKYIYIIGNLGYISDRISDHTPVYKLDWQSFQIETVATMGTNPGWISKHQAIYHQPSNTIQITGGKVWLENNRKAEYIDNYLNYTLDLSSLTWKINQ